MKVEATDEMIENIIHDLDVYAREYDVNNYALPVFNEHLKEMVEIVKNRLQGGE